MDWYKTWEKIKSDKSEKSVFVTDGADFQIIIFLLNSEIVVVFGDDFFLYFFFICSLGRFIHHLHIENGRCPEFLKFWNGNLSGGTSFEDRPLLLGKTTVFHFLLNRLRQLSVDLGQRVVYHADESLCDCIKLIRLDVCLGIFLDQSVLVSVLVEVGVFGEESFEFLPQNLGSDVFDFLGFLVEFRFSLVFLFDAIDVFFLAFEVLLVFLIVLLSLGLWFWDRLFGWQFVFHV